MIQMCFIVIIIQNECNTLPQTGSGLEFLLNLISLAQSL